MKKIEKLILPTAIELFASSEGKFCRNDGIVKSGCGVHKVKKGKGSYSRKSKHTSLGF